MTPSAVSRLVKGTFDEAIVRETARELAAQLGAPATFALLFATPDFAPHATELVELIRVYGRVTVLAGCTGSGLVGTGIEQEEGSGFSLLIVSLPEVTATPLYLDPDELTALPAPHDWMRQNKIAPESVKAWLVFLNPFTFQHEAWLKQWTASSPGIPIFGALAGGFPADPEAWVFCNDQVLPGGVALALQGEIEVHAVVSQGCKPIGEPLTVTHADRHVLLTLGSRPAYEVLSEVYKDLTEAEREQARGHLFAGLALNEYLEEFKRGDFLVRNILGADPKSGAVAIGATPRVGQTMQYQLRDSQAASEELRQLLEREQLRPGVAPVAALLCTCTGRGKGLFGRPHHDAGLVEELFPGLPLAGLFSNGEIGPVGQHSFTHSYTASVALLASTARRDDVAA